MREAVAGIALDQAVGEREAVADVAVAERGREGALDEIGVSWIGAQRLAEIDGGGAGVAVGAGDERGEVVALLRVANLDGGRAGWAA